jgi:hypothetical protein
MATPSWQISSNSSKSLVLAVGTFAVGLVFIWLTRHVTVGDTNALAARWLGVMLAAVGLAGVIWGEKIVVTVDTGQRCLRFDCRRRVGNLNFVVRFEEVESVNVVRIGTRSDGTPSFWLQIARNDGKTFATGRWSTSEMEIARVADRLANEIGCERQGGEPPAPASVGRVAVAVVAAVALYVVWYRFTVGPWCEAMWYGTLPPVFVLSVFGGVLGLLRRFWRD